MKANFKVSPGICYSLNCNGLILRKTKLKIRKIYLDAFTSANFYSSILTLSCRNLIYYMNTGQLLQVVVTR